MSKEVKEYLSKAVTQYHAVDEVIKLLQQNGFKELKENEDWNIQSDTGYYVCKDSSALIALRTNRLNKENYGFNIVASHTDSPCLKIKSNSSMKTDSYTKLNCEVYGGTLLYTWLDKPLKIAGRVIAVNKDNLDIESKIVTLAPTVIIPSVAIHMNREANNSLKLNPQTDLCALAGLNLTEDFIISAIKKEIDESKYKIVDYDLYLYNATQNFYSGLNDEFLCSPRLDNLTSVYSSIEALINSDNKKINISVIFDNEEVGSSTKQGAGGRFLINTLERLNTTMGYTQNDLYIAFENSFIVSCDNAHAMHPNHPELNDPTNKVIMGNGIVIKHHANQNYTTDGFSSGIFKEIMNRNNIRYQDFYMKSDMRCGSTLGAISSSQVSLRSIDIGIGQLAMHSNMETMAVNDYDEMVECLKAFYSSDIRNISFDKVKI